MKYFVYFILLFFNLITHAQSWTIVGDTVASDWEADWPYITIDKFNTPHIVFYSDQAGTLARASVRKFDGIQWAQVGPNINSGIVGTTTMDFDTAGLPYVAYRDYNNNTNKATVKRFDGTNWIAVGNEGFTPGGATYTSIKIGPDNTPYLAFGDFQYYASASVMKFDGTNWVYIGQQGFSPQAQGGGALYTSLAIDKVGTLYVAFADLSNNWRASVMKFNAINWVYVGAPNISGGGVGNTSIVTDSQGAPIVAYTDGYAHVRRFNGTSWVSVGQPSITPADCPYVTIDKQDNLYLTYTENGQASVMKYNGSSWFQAGNAAFSPTLVGNTTMAVDTNGTIYVCFKDYTSRYKNGFGPYYSASVMKLQNTLVTDIKKTEGSSFLLNVFPNPASGMVQINFNPVKATKGQLNITNISGEIIYSETFFGKYNKEVNLSKYSKGIYFIEIKTAEAKERRKIVLE